MVASEDGITSLKPGAEWTDVEDDEDDEALGNSKALSVIFNGVDKNMLRLINTCSEAKEVGEILKIAHEDNSKFVCQGRNSLPIRLRI